jgi:hypothetical protein
VVDFPHIVDGFSFSRGAFWFKSKADQGPDWGGDEVLSSMSQTSRMAYCFFAVIP